ncbi:MAG: hypothetical protein AB7Q00_06070 [Phycisphaerales bacterium]
MSVERYYLVTGTEPKGKWRVRRVRATSAQGAIDTLASRGFTKIELETDDITLCTPGGEPRPNWMITPLDLYKMHRMSLTQCVLYSGVILFRAALIVLVPLGVYVAYQLSHGRAFGIAGGIMATILLLLTISIVSVARSARSGMDLERRYVRGEFLLVVEAAEKMMRTARGQGQRLAYFKVASTYPRALVHLGRLDEAKEYLDRLSERNDADPYYVNFVSATTFEVAGLTDEFEVLAQDMVDHRPDCALGWHLLAVALGQHRDQLEEARQHLLHAQILPVTDRNRRMLRGDFGVQLVLEGRLLEAIEELVVASQALREVSHQSPIAEVNLASMEGWRAVALFMLGRVEEAKVVLDRHWPTIDTHKYEPVWSHCVQTGLVKSGKDEVGPA